MLYIFVYEILSLQFSLHIPSFLFFFLLFFSSFFFFFFSFREDERALGNGWGRHAIIVSIG